MAFAHGSGGGGAGGLLAAATHPDATARAALHGARVIRRQARAAPARRRNAAAGLRGLLRRPSVDEPRAALDDCEGGQAGANAWCVGRGS